MSVLPVAERWFTIDGVEEGVHLVTEPHCHRLVKANAFLVKGRTRDMLVDSGMGIGRLRTALAPLLDKPLVLVTTHVHVDHIGSHHEFPDVEILVHPLEAQALADPPGPRGLGFDLFPPDDRAALAAMGFDTGGLLIDALPSADYDPAAYKCHGIAPTGVVEEGDTIDLGARRFRVLHVPGHSPGGIALWDEASATLIAGDTIYDGILVDGIAGADIAAYRTSMRRLRDLPVRVVHGGHKPSFGRDRMIAIIDGYLARGTP